MRPCCGSAYSASRCFDASSSRCGEVSTDLHHHPHVAALPLPAGVLPSFIRGQLPLVDLNGRLAALHALLQGRVAVGGHAGRGEEKLGKGVATAARCCRAQLIDLQAPEPVIAGLHASPNPMQAL